MPARAVLLDPLPPAHQLPSVGDRLLIAPRLLNRGQPVRLDAVQFVAWGRENVSTKLVCPPVAAFGEKPPSPYRAFRLPDLVSLDGRTFLVTPERLRQLREGEVRALPLLLEQLESHFKELEDV